VQQERLRSALLELAGDIVMKADIYEALDRFQGKFDNRYIDSLCITILQALESGQALELLGDIGEQIKDMEETVLERKKAALDRSITFYQLGVLAVVLGIALYACVTYMFGAAAGF
jgi:pilus assembly protein TadC